MRRRRRDEGSARNDGLSQPTQHRSGAATGGPEAGDEQFGVPPFSTVTVTATAQPRLGRTVRVIALLPLVVLTLSIGFASTAAVEAKAAGDRLAGLLVPARVAAEELENAFTRQFVDLRGYVIFGDEASSRRIADARRSVDGLLHQLDRLSSTEPLVANARLAVISADERWTAQAAAVVERRGAGDLGGASDLLRRTTAPLAGALRATTDELQATLDTLVRPAEKQALAARREVIVQAMLTLGAGVLLVSATVVTSRARIVEPVSRFSSWAEATANGTSVRPLPAATPRELVPVAKVISRQREQVTRQEAEATADEQARARLEASALAVTTTAEDAQRQLIELGHELRGLRREHPDATAHVERLLDGVDELSHLLRPGIGW